MFLRMLKQSFTVGLKGKFLAIITIAFGASLATAMLNVSLDIGDKINRELKSYGANILVVPKMDTLPAEIGGIEFNPLADRQYLEEESIPKIKTTFWAYNIVGFTPYLDASAKIDGVKRPVAVVGTWFNKRLNLPTGEELDTGIRQIKPWWEVKGRWVDDKDANGAIVGSTLAVQLGIKPGQELTVNVLAKEGERQVKIMVQGIVNSGGQDDDKIFVPLGLVQKVLKLPGKIGKLEVSALTTPENELARKSAADPESLTAKEFETWYCTAYVSSIAYQIMEAIPGSEAKAIRQVSESEGVILSKIQFLMLVLTIAALVSSGLGISSLMTTKVLERNKEIGLMKAIGAQNSAVLLLFLTEAAITGILGGVLGYGLGLGFAQIIGQSVFGTSLSVKGLVIPIVLALSVVVTFIGSLSAMRLIIGLRPAEVLRGGR